MLNKKENTKMLKPKFKIGDQVFARELNGVHGKDGFALPDEVVGIEYLLPYTIQGANGDTIHDGGYFQYQIMTMGGEVLVEPERALGKRRKQR